MRRFLFLIAIAAICNTGMAQNRHAILFSGEYVVVPGYELMGAGYTLAYQQQIHKCFHLEGGASYALASNTIERSGVVNQVELLDLNYHHASYSFYAVALLKIRPGARVTVDMFAGAVLTYQSGVFDINHYRILDGSGTVSNYPDIIYKNESREGLFFGGTAGIRLSMAFGSSWSIFAGGQVLGIIKGESSVTARAGCAYRW